MVPWLCLLLLVSGCNGCHPFGSLGKGKSAQDATKSEEQKKAEKEKDQEEYKSSELMWLPHDGTTAAAGAKPGHWLSVREELTASRSDFSGELQLQHSNRAGRAMFLGDSEFRLQSVRAVSLPKQQKKTVELTAFVPPSDDNSNQIWLQSELKTVFGGSPLHTKSQVAPRMAVHQAYLTVLAARPDQYGYLKSLDATAHRNNALGIAAGSARDYLVLQPEIKQNMPLPSWSLMWTTIAYIVWDDVDPTVMTREQQQAMIEWLHWGGQLIVNGPTSLDRLKQSFLGPYLPCASQGTVSLSREQTSELDQTWSITPPQSKHSYVFPWNDRAIPELVQLTLQPEGYFIPRTANLVAERRVGRGRICVTAFGLTQRAYINWRSFDNFFNATLLRRPGRTYGYSDETGRTSHWIDEVADFFPSPHINESSVDVAQLETGEFVASRATGESLLTSRLRYFSRDATNERKGMLADQEGHWDLAGYRAHPVAGPAGWNNDGDIEPLARQGLKSAAGITIPNANLVLLWLGAYLFILVPANWTLFRAIDRVEWAWVAVPILAVVGAIAVVRLAQLDIGFARSRTELAIVETQGSLPRAHVTRFTGLYTALSTAYEISFSDASSVCLPLTHASDRGQTLQVARDVRLRRVDRKDDRIRLENFQVSSNTTGMLRSEQMLDVQGEFRYVAPSDSGGEIDNQTAFNLRDVGILRRTLRNELEFAWIGPLRSHAKLPVGFRPVSNPANVERAWPQFGDASDRLQPSIQSLLEVATNPQRLYAGDTLLVGWVDDELPGINVNPTATQVTQRAIWVAHLTYGKLPAPRGDANAPPEVALEAPEEEDNQP